MIRIAKGAMLFVAGFAAAALLFMGNSNVPQAEAGGCVMQSAQAKRHDQGINDNRFAVRYAPPQCIMDAGFRVSNVRMDNDHSFIVTYKKQ